MSADLDPPPTPKPFPCGLYLVFEHSLRDLSTAAAPHKLICCALERHAAIEQGDVQIKNKAQNICAACSPAQAQRWRQPGATEGDTADTFLLAALKQ